MVKRISLTLVLVVGAVWVLATIVLGLWGKTAAADRLTGDLKPAFSASGVKQSTADAATVKAFTTELDTKTIPFLADQLHMSTADVTTYLAKNFPAVGKVLADTSNDGSTFANRQSYLSNASDYLDQVTAALSANRQNFADTNDIPASWLPIKVVAWLFFVLGALGLVLGVVALREPDLTARLGAVTAVLGVVVIAVTFVLGLPGKTKALDNLTDSFRPVFVGNGPLSIGEGAQYLQNVRAADIELETKVLPALPDLLHTTPAGLVAVLKANSPVVASALTTHDLANAKVSALGGVLDRFDALAGAVSSNVVDFRSTDRIPGLGLPASSVPWLLVGPALLLLLAGCGMAGAPGLRAGANVAEGGLSGANA